MNSHAIRKTIRISSIDKDFRTQVAESLTDEQTFISTDVALLPDDMYILSKLENAVLGLEDVPYSQIQSLVDQHFQYGRTHALAALQVQWSTKQTEGGAPDIKVRLHKDMHWCEGH
jgi:hypothetical protein